MNPIYRRSHCKSRSICAENFTGEKGKAGMATEGYGAEAARELGQGWKVSPAFILHAGETFTLADIAGSGVIRHIWITPHLKNRALVLRMFWDNAEAPSVEVPLGDFFACSDPQQYTQITSQVVCVNPNRAYNCYWEMPFRSRAKITLENLSNEDTAIFYQIDYTEEAVPEDALYFCAQFRRTNPLPYKEVYTILDGIQGAGHYVGTYLYWGVNNNGWWGEGEIKFYLDGDREFPTICGTGTEDYFCGSWDFDDGTGHYATFSTPYVGMPKISSTAGKYQSQTRFSLYRWHLPDPIFFDEDIRVTIQALGWRSEGRYLPLQDDISSVAYFYLDRPCDVTGTLPDKDGLEII